MSATIGSVVEAQSRLNPQPDWCPQDVWTTATRTMGGGDPMLAHIIARAILAERERCAKVAEGFRHDNPFPTIQGAIAAAIRGTP